MLMTKFLFDRLVTLFAEDDTVFDPGDPWYINTLIAPIVPSFSLETLPPGSYGPGNGGGAWPLTVSPQRVMVNPLTGDPYTVVGTDSVADVNQSPTNGNDAYPFTLYGFYLQSPEGLEHSYGAMLIDAPIEYQDVGQGVPIPPFAATFTFHVNAQS